MSMYMIEFKTFQNICKYCKLGCEDGRVELTCRHENNIPKGSSWGNCNENDCPFIKK